MHAIEGLRLEDLAKKLYVSPNYLSATIKKETGVKYQQHILNAKIKVAKQMLDDTRMRIEEIAHAVGYENYVSFYNTFKRMEGKTPTEYRLRRTVE
jgi:YesN/AraC family two-component response regulator